MQRIVTCIAASTAVLAASMSAALAGAPLGRALGTTLGTTLPVAEGGLLGLVAAGVVGGIWLARRKR